MYILGLNTYHGNSSACLIADGEIVAAAEEERFCRLKHWAGFPAKAVKYCLAEAGIRLSDIDHIAVNSNPTANLLHRASYVLRRRPSRSLVFDRLRNQGSRLRIDVELQKVAPGEPFHSAIHRVEHHLAHLASCFLVSPFHDAVAVSVDGFGDFASAAWGVGRGGALSVEGRILFPHSLGIFYQALTQYLGFSDYGDEYKVMGLAPYGSPRQMNEMRRIVRLMSDGRYALNLEYFRHQDEKVAFQWDGVPKVGRLYSSALVDLLGPERTPDKPLTDRHRDIARSTQAMYEEAFFNLINSLHARYGLDALALAGGCAMNSVANGKVRRMSRFRRLYVQSAAGDAGGALGAAMQVWHEQAVAGGMAGNRRPDSPVGDEGIGHTVMAHAYWGPSYADEIGQTIKMRQAELGDAGCLVEVVADETRLCDETARAIAEGQVVGWFQGRMEWGPRALGNRSIVCDPRRADMMDILNRKIKRRESFRPFAPSILREHVSAWFEEDGDVPFMMQVYQIRSEKRKLIPAVTHVDGSGRLQTVTREANPRYYHLIQSFSELTGIPMVLNTSFNENEPIVCHPREALDCFLRTKMDLLVMNNTLVRRSHNGSEN